MTEKGRQKDTLSETVHEELRVVLSRSRSPLSLRVAKWLLFLGITRRLYGTRWFWAWILGLPLAGVATHLLYRHKTQGWRRPWGGWRDVEAANPTKRQQGASFREDLIRNCPKSLMSGPNASP